MKLNRTGSNWNRLERNKINENWDIIEGSHNKLEDEFDDVVGKITDEVVGHLIDSAKLIWKEPVDTVDDLPTNAEVGETRMVREADPDGVSYVYRYDGEKWEKIQAIDATLVNEVDRRLTAQLAETVEKTSLIPNSKNPLIIPTYDGSYQTVHPDAHYFEDGFLGWKYLMAHTPYPNTNDFYENPSLVVSNDGIVWINFPGLENPIDSVTEEENAEGKHYSDAILVRRENTLEMWYRYNHYDENVERYYRRTTTNGVDWTPRELVYDFSPAQFNHLSPSVIYENGKYRMWFVYRTGVAYMESTDAKNWSEQIEVPLTFKDDVKNEKGWHLQVYKENDNLYHLVLNTTTSDSNTQEREILWGVSTDGMSFNDLTTVLRSANNMGTWDNRAVYRASMIKVKDTYRLYYSARNINNRWFVGLSEGREMTSLKSSNNIASNMELQLMYARYINAIAERFTAKEVRVSTKEEPAYLKMVQAGVSGGGFKTTSKNNVLQVVSDSGEVLGSLEMSTAFISTLKAAYNFINVEDQIRIDRSGASPEIIFRKVGSHTARLSSEGNNVIDITSQNGEIYGHLRAATVILGDTSIEREGSIRFNKASKKHQGFDGEKWNDLY